MVTSCSVDGSVTVFELDFGDVDFSKYVLYRFARVLLNGERGEKISLEDMGNIMLRTAKPRVLYENNQRKHKLIEEQ